MKPCDKGKASNLYCQLYVFSLTFGLSVSHSGLSGNVLFDSHGTHACQLRFLLPVQDPVAQEERGKNSSAVCVCRLLGLEQQWLELVKY